MIGLRILPGTWWFASKTDARWCASGKVTRVPFVFSLPVEAKVTLDHMRRQFGDPPDDLEYGCLRA